MKKKTKKHIWYFLFFLLNVIYKVLLDLSFTLVISHRYAYISGGPDVNYRKCFFSWVVFLVFFFLLRFVKDRKIKFASDVLWITSIIPSFSIFWVKNLETNVALLLVLYWFAFALGAIFISKLFAQRRFPKKVSLKSPIITFLYAFAVFFTLYISYKYSHFRLYIKMDSIYDARRETASQLSSLENYIFSWNYVVFLPLFLTHHLREKKYVLVLIDIVCFFLCFGIRGDKIVLLVLALCFFFFFFGKTKLRSNVMPVLLILINAFIFFGIVTDERISSVINGFVYRMLYVPSEAHYFYYDFFVDGEKLFLRQSILRYFFDNPYNDVVSILIGSSTKYNYTGSLTNLNNGLFSDAFANFGILGVVLYPVLIAVGIGYVSDKLQVFEYETRMCLGSVLLINLISASWIQLLLTGGIIVMLLLLMVLNKKPFSYKQIQINNKSIEFEKN